MHEDLLPIYHLQARVYTMMERFRITLYNWVSIPLGLKGSFQNSNFFSGFGRLASTPKLTVALLGGDTNA